MERLVELGYVFMEVWVASEADRCVGSGQGKLSPVPANHMSTHEELNTNMDDWFTYSNCIEKYNILIPDLTYITGYLCEWLGSYFSKALGTCFQLLDVCPL